MLQDKVILITGGADGIGWECAKAYARNNAILCIIDVKEIDKTKKVELFDKNHSFFTVDVTNLQEMEHVFSVIKEKYKCLDAIHNNVAVALIAAPLDKTTDADWQLMMDVNLKSILYTTRLGIDLLKQSKGTILNTSSLVGEIGQNNHAAYVATKGATNALTKAMALDYAPFSIRVNAISPAAIKTPAVEKWSMQQPDVENIETY